MSDTLTAANVETCGGSLNPQGKFIWYELMTSDHDAALDFYKAVVGWNTADHENSTVMGMRYTILSAREQGVGGVMQLTDQMCEGGARPGWVGYIGVADTDAKAKEIAESGGTVLMEPDDIPNVGRFAMVADPGGAAFYLLTPLPQENGPPSPHPQTPGVFSWHELYTSQGQEGAFGFYSSHFGWETITEMDMGPMGKYRIFGRDGVQLGGMMDRPENIPVSHWAFYISVEAIDAAVERIKTNGGQVVMDPHDVPGGSWIVQAIDPQGAHFALVSPKR
jgi:uncharacterized protein